MKRRDIQQILPSPKLLFVAYMHSFYPDREPGPNALQHYLMESRLLALVDNGDGTNSIEPIVFSRHHQELRPAGELPGFVGVAEEKVTTDDLKAWSEIIKGKIAAKRAAYARKVAKDGNRSPETTPL